MPSPSAGAPFDMATNPYQDGRGRDAVERYVPLVKRIAYHLISRVSPTVDVNDLIQAGLIGLLDVLEKMPDPDLEPKFEAYAAIRIRGAMLDELRAGDPLPRRARARMRRAQEVLTDLEQRLGRPPSESEIAERLDCTLADYHALLREANAAQILHWEDFEGDGESFFVSASSDAGPLELLESESFREELTDAIGRLPERERLTLSLYYDEELNLKEIGAVLGVSESRVSQIMRQASLRLRARLQDWAGQGAQVMP